ncbi:MAG TPA: hypothetical protein VJO16_18935 [Candidatus Acidoferrum sp.]|nr:hypothetical protein [Candidatus Acidoferrum sp.]
MTSGNNGIWSGEVPSSALGPGDVLVVPEKTASVVLAAAVAIP